MTYAKRSNSPPLLSIRPRFHWPPQRASAALHNGWQPDPDELAEGRAAVLASAQPG